MRSLRPTALGVKAALFFLLLLGAFGATPYSNLFFLLLSFLAILGVAGLWGTTSNLRRLRAEVEEIEPAPVGAGSAARVRLSAGRRVRFALVLRMTLEGGAVVRAPLGVVQGSRREIVRLPGLPRGLYRIRAAHVESSWPLGLFRSARRVAAPSEMVVHPVPKGPADARGRAGGFDELLGGRPRNDSLQPSSLREYRPGDEFRQVHWKATARRGTPVVKEWEGGGGQGAEVVLDRRCDETTLEEALSLLCAVGLAARESKERLTLHSQGMSATFGQSHRPWRDLLAFLAGAEVLAANAPAPPPAAPDVPRLGGTR